VTAAVGALRPPDPATVGTVVAAHDLEAGTRLTASDVRVVQLPQAVAVAGAAGSTQAVVGATTAVPLGAGTPLVPGVLVESVTGPAGTVVAAVRFADDAVASYLRPGDRVDVVAATPDGGPGGTLASRALVLPGRAGTGEGSDGLLGTGDADTGPVLLAVTADEASALAGATGGSLLSAVIVE
jgi:Flp pilus assembly protein CpaB